MGMVNSTASNFLALLANFISLVKALFSDYV